jgi:intracellular sulfur oxidation DsrE/DsrF family protein
MRKSLHPRVLTFTALALILVPLTPALSQVHAERGTAVANGGDASASTLQMPRALLPSHASRVNALDSPSPTARTLAPQNARHTVIKRATAGRHTRLAKEVKKSVPTNTAAWAAMKSPRGITKVAAAKTHTVATEKVRGTVAKAVPAISETPALKKAHRVVIQVSQNDSALMNMVLNNAENLTKHYRDKDEEVQIELVAYGPGLHMVRSDTSPVKARLQALAGTMKHVKVSGCENTRSAQAKQENADITLIPEASTVPTGIGRITELQEQGWTYVRP